MVVLTWTNDSSGTWNGLNSIFFTDSTTGYVVGNSGTDFVERHKPIIAKFIIYPNPANEKISVISEGISKQEIDISIFTMNGEQVFQEQFYIQNQVDLDVNLLSKGIYLLKIQSREGIEVKKIVID